MLELEGLRLARSLWTGKPVDWDGRWKVEQGILGPTPSRQPGPPIWIGGSTRAALRRAAERGDGWLPQGVPPMGLAEAIAYVRRVRGDEPIEIGANSPWLYVGTPSFDLGPNARSGPGEVLAGILLDLKAFGVNHVGVRFRTRSADGRALRRISISRCGRCCRGTCSRRRAIAC